MKKLVFIYSLFFFALASCSKTTETGNPEPGKKPDVDNGDNQGEWLAPIKAASYNIEYNNANNTENPWNSRKELVRQVFERYDLDIVGVQEPYRIQLSDLLSLMPDYNFVGTDVQGATSVNNRLSVTIFYKTNKIEIQNWGKFWLSATPNVASKGWDADQYRICTWAKAKDKETNKEFFFFSTHLDHIGTQARTKGVQLLLDTIPVIANGYPAIITGDFNSSQNTSYYNLMVGGSNIKDSYNLTTNKTNSLRGTYNGYDVNRMNSDRIDHVFVTTQYPVKINSWAIRTDIYNGKYPSDHFPVITEISFEPNK